MFLAFRLDTSLVSFAEKRLIYGNLVNLNGGWLGRIMVNKGFITDLCSFDNLMGLFHTIGARCPGCTKLREDLDWAPDDPRIACERYHDPKWIEVDAGGGEALPPF